jgi:DNA-binding NarL/FixJ family response regulator
MPIRIILADDHDIIREGVRALLERQPDMEVVAEADNGRTAVKLTQKHKPNVVVMDVTMPDLNGIDAARQIGAESPDTKIIALSMHSDGRFVSKMLEAGALAYLLKSDAFEELTNAIHAVVSSESYLSPAVAEFVFKDYVHLLSKKAPSAFDDLTENERQVLQLIAEGFTTKDIASRLHVSVKAIEAHRRKIMDKLGIRSIAELTKFAIREGLTSLEP